jgi:hypothetical protein
MFNVVNEVLDDDDDVGFLNNGNWFTGSVRTENTFSKRISVDLCKEDLSNVGSKPGRHLDKYFSENTLHHTLDGIVVDFLGIRKRRNL